MRQLLYTRIKKLLSRSEEGASMVEYALLLFLVTAALVGIITTLSGEIQNVFQGVVDVFQSQGGTSGT